MAEILTDIKDVKSKLVELGVDYDTKSMRFLIQNKKSKAQVSDIREEENTIYLLACGSKSKTLDEAFEIIGKLQEDCGVCSENVHIAAMSIGRERNFFMNGQAMQMMEATTEDADLASCQEIVDAVAMAVDNYKNTAGFLERKL